MLTEAVDMTIWLAEGGLLVVARQRRMATKTPGIIRGDAVSVWIFKAVEVEVEALEMIF